MDDRKILRSRAICLLCNYVMESKHRHHYVTCRCGKSMLDGGTDYVRYGSPKLSNVELLTEYEGESTIPLGTGCRLKEN